MNLRIHLPVRAFGGALLSAALLLTACGAPQPALVEERPRPVRLYTIDGGGTGQERLYPGIVQAARAVEMSFRVGGPLIELPVREGERVTQGQLLAKIDPRDYQSRLENIASQLASARADLLAMRTGARPEDLRRLEAGVAAARADVTKAEADLRRSEELYAQDVISASEFEVARRNVDLARANLETAQAQLESGQAGARAEEIESMEARIRGLEAQRQQAADALADTELHAPFEGFIARIFVDNFQTVSPGQPILRMHSEGEMEVVFQVPQRDVAQAPREVGDVDVSHVRVTFDAYPGVELPVFMKEFTADTDPGTQTYDVTLGFEPDDLNLVPGMTAQVKGERPITQGAPDRIVVPVEAVTQDGGASIVWVVDRESMTVSARQVETGPLTQNGIEIRAGLEPGDTIAATGTSHLAEDMQVRPMETGETA